MPQDVGLSTPPSADVTGQMQSSPSPQPGAGGGLSQLMAMLGSGGQPGAAPAGNDISEKVMGVTPLLNQLALQVPALAPDVDKLVSLMRANMGASPAPPPGAPPAPGMSAPP